MKSKVNEYFKVQEISAEHPQNLRQKRRYIKDARRIERQIVRVTLLNIRKSW